MSSLGEIVGGVVSQGVVRVRVVGRAGEALASDVDPGCGGGRVFALDVNLRRLLPRFIFCNESSSLSRRICDESSIRCMEQVQVDVAL